MKRILLAGAIGAACAALCAPGAYAQVYVGLGYSSFNVTEDFGGEEVTLGAVTARVGYGFNRHFALEGEAGFGVKDDSFGPTLPVDVGIQYHVGGFAVGRLPLFGPVTLYGRAGYVETAVDPNFSQISDGKGGAYGGGLEFDFTDRLVGRLDYTQQRLETRENIESFSASAAMKF